MSFREPTKLRKIASRLWGYDYFISYHWDSGGAYAVALARALRDLGYECFLDRAEYAIGDDWKREGEIALRNTQHLVLVATREAVTQSNPVAHELEIFAQRGRHVIPIVFGAGFSDEDRKNIPALRFISDSQLFVVEEVGNLKTGPSSAIVDQVVRTRRLLRRRVLRSRIVTGVIATLSLAVVIVCMFWHQSDVDRVEAERQTRYAFSRQLAIESRDLLDSRPRLGLLLASEAVLATTRSGENPTPEALESLSRAIGQLGGLPAVRDDEAESLAVSPDGRWLVRGWQLWSLSETGRSGRSIRLRGRVDPMIHFNRVKYARFSPDGRWLLTLNTGHNIEPYSACIWDLWSPTLAKDSPFQIFDGLDRSQFGPRCIDFSRDGQWLAIGGNLWDLRAPVGGAPRLRRLPHANGAVAFSCDSRWLATGAESNGMSLAHLWNLTAQDPTSSVIHLPGTWYNAENLLFSPDGHWLVSRGRNGPCLLWDLSSDTPGTRSIALKNDGGESTWVSLDPKGRWLITSGAWDLSGNDPTQATVERLAFNPTTGFSPNGKWLLVAQSGNTTLLDLRDATLSSAPAIRLDFEVLTFGSGLDAEAVFNFSPDSRWLAIQPMMTRYLYLMDLYSDAPNAAMLRLPAARGTNLAFSPDGRWLFTQDYDFPLNAELLLPVASQVSLRNLSIQEWRKYSPSKPYHRTFDSLPGPYDPNVPDEFREVVASDLNSMAWAVVRTPGRSAADYGMALRQALSASGRNPEDFAMLNTLGLAYYRNERYADALRTLLACVVLRKEFRPPPNQIYFLYDEPADYSFLAMSAHRMGKRDEVAYYLDKLRERFKDSRHITEEDRSFLREAESTIKYDPLNVNQ